jgi:hypothetical protein
MSHEHGDEQATQDADREAGHIDRRIDALSKEAPQGDGQAASKHGATPHGLWLDASKFLPASMDDLPIQSRERRGRRELLHGIRTSRSVAQDRPNVASNASPGRGARAAHSHSWRAEIMDASSIIIIGAGIGGLSTGCYAQMSPEK